MERLVADKSLARDHSDTPHIQTVFHAAYEAMDVALKPDVIIKSAFCERGIVPYNRQLIEKNAHKWLLGNQKMKKRSEIADRVLAVVDKARERSQQNLIETHQSRIPVRATLSKKPRSFATIMESVSQRERLKLKQLLVKKLTTLQKKKKGGKKYGRSRKKAKRSDVHAVQGVIPSIITNLDGIYAYVVVSILLCPDCQIGRRGNRAAEHNKRCEKAARIRQQKRDSNKRRRSEKKAAKQKQEANGDVSTPNKRRRLAETVGNEN